MLFDELSPRKQDILKRVYNFEPDEVNAMFTSAAEIDELLRSGCPAVANKKSKSSAKPFTDDGEEDGEIDLSLSKAESAVIKEAHTASVQRGLKPDQRVGANEMSEVQKLLADMKEADDLDDDDDLDD